MALQNSALAISLLLLSFSHVKTSDIGGENVIRRYYFELDNLIDFEKPAPTATSISFKGTLYFKSIKDRPYAFSVNILNYSLAVSGDYGTISDLSACKDFCEIDASIKEPIINVYDASGLLQYIEINSEIESELSQVLKLYIFYHHQVDICKLQEKDECTNSPIITKETYFGNDRYVIYNTNCENLGNETKSYWIEKDFNKLAGSKKEHLDMCRIDTQNICATGETRNCYGFEETVQQFKLNATQKSIESTESYILKNYRPLKNDLLRVVTTTRLFMSLVDLEEESCLPVDAIQKASTLNKFSLERPDKTMIKQAGNSIKLDYIPLDYLLLCSENEDLLYLTLLKYAINCQSCS